MVSLMSLQGIFSQVRVWPQRMWRRICLLLAGSPSNSKQKQHGTRDDSTPEETTKSAANSPTESPPTEITATTEAPLPQPAPNGESDNDNKVVDPRPDGPNGAEPQTSDVSSDTPPASPSGGESHEDNVRNESGAFKQHETKKGRPGGGKRPIDMGGKRTGTYTTKAPRAKRAFAVRPELVCRRPPGSWQWEVILAADGECRMTEVRRDSEPLEMMNNECRLSSLIGRLTAVFEDGRKHKLALFDGKPLIFKLRNKWTGEGRKTGGITKGHFVVIAPNEWERTGHVPVDPEGCSDKGFTAHFFYRSGTESTEKIGGFRECSVPTTTSGFELKGERIFDDSELGDLYVGAVPHLNIPTRIAWVRVGEERTNGWRGENFEPNERNLSKVLNDRQGRFFIRVYDSNVKLLDSGEFRYLRDLKEIRVNGKPYSEDTFLAPTPTGHHPTRVSFIGTGSTTIQPILPEGVTGSKEQGRNLVVEPHPSRDRISCALESGTGSVDIVLNLPRFWWRMQRHGSESGAWHDTPLLVTRQEFREHAHANATIRLRFPQRSKSIRAGFDNELDRLYYRGKGQDDCVIPLADFVDYSQIDRRLDDDAPFNVECGGVKLTLILVSADPVPTIIAFTREPTTVSAGEQATLSWATRDADAGTVAISPEIGPVALSGSLVVAPSKTTTYTLTLMASGKDDVTKAVTVTVRPSHPPREKPIAWVRPGGGRWRHGKGFSYREILAAGLTVAEVTHRLLPFDKRRRSAHQANTERIKRLIDA